MHCYQGVLRAVLPDWCAVSSMNTGGCVFGGRGCYGLLQNCYRGSFDFPSAVVLFGEFGVSVAVEDGFHGGGLVVDDGGYFAVGEGPGFEEGVVDAVCDGVAFVGGLAYVVGVDCGDGD